MALLLVFLSCLEFFENYLCVIFFLLVIAHLMSA